VQASEYFDANVFDGKYMQKSLDQNDLSFHQKKLTKKFQPQINKKSHLKKTAL
jgi:hypothetical protein